MLDAQPAAVYPASPDDPSYNSMFGFLSEHHRIHFLTIVLSTIVAVGMKFDPTFRQRNLSSTTALIACMYIAYMYIVDSLRHHKFDSKFNMQEMQ